MRPILGALFMIFVAWSGIQLQGIETALVIIAGICGVAIGFSYDNLRYQAKVIDKHAERISHLPPNREA